MGKRKSQEEYISEVKRIHNNKYLYDESKYTMAKNPITIKCPEHGYFTIRAASHLNGQGCPECSKLEKRANEIAKWSSEFEQKARLKHKNKYDYSKVNYIKATEKVCIICPKHGEFWQEPHVHLMSCGCPKCAIEEAGDKYRCTTEEFIEKARKIHEDTYDYSKVNYKGAFEKVCIICPEHGEFWQTPSDHLQNCGCPQCVLKSQSKLLNQLKSKFDTLYFEWEYTPEWLSPQRIDIAIPIYNIGIEYDGEQHFIPISRFGGKIGLRKTQWLDNIKNLKCKEHNFHLFRVPYYYSNEDFEELCNKIQQIIDNTGQITEEVENGQI